MQIDVVRPLDLGPAELDAWRAIQAADPRLASPYLAPEWALALARSGGPDARAGRVAVWREGGAPVGFFPARVGPFTALPTGGPLCDYQAVVAGPEVRVAPRALVRALGVQRLDLIHALADPAAFDGFLQGFGESYVADLAGGFDAYAAQRKEAGSGVLADTAKKKRKLEKELGPARFDALVADEADWEQALAWKRVQYAATGQTDIFAIPWVPTFLRRLREDDADDRFGARLFTLRAGDRLVATHIALQNGPVLHAWFIAHDEEAGRFSPGVILMVEMMRWAAERGITEFDLGPGAYRFKTSLATGARRVGHGYVGRPSTATAGRWAQYRVRRVAEALPLGRLSHLPGKAMRRLDLWRGLHQG